MLEIIAAGFLATSCIPTADYKLPPLQSTEPFRCSQIDLNKTSIVHETNSPYDAQKTFNPYVRVFVFAPNNNTSSELPVIIYSHGGFGGADPRFLTTDSYIYKWVREGYIVVAPTHSDSFLFNEVALSNEKTCPGLEGNIHCVIPIPNEPCPDNPSTPNFNEAIYLCFGYRAVDADDPKAWKNRVTDVYGVYDHLAEIVNTLDGSGHDYTPSAKPFLAGFSFGAFTTQLAGGVLVKGPDVGSSDGATILPLGNRTFSGAILLSPQGLESQAYAVNGISTTDNGLFYMSSSLNSWRRNGADTLNMPAMALTSYCDVTEADSGTAEEFPSKTDVIDLSSGGSLSNAKYSFNVSNANGSAGCVSAPLEGNGEHSDFGLGNTLLGTPVDATITGYIGRLSSLFLTAFNGQKPRDGARLALRDTVFLRDTADPALQLIQQTSGYSKATPAALAGDGNPLVDSASDTFVGQGYIVGRDATSITGSTAADFVSSVQAPNGTPTTITLGTGRDRYALIAAQSTFDTFTDFDPQEGSGDRIDASAMVDIYGVTKPSTQFCLSKGSFGGGAATDTDVFFTRTPGANGCTAADRVRVLRLLDVDLPGFTDTFIFD